MHLSTTEAILNLGCPVHLAVILCFTRGWFGMSAKDIKETVDDDPSMASWSAVETEMKNHDQAMVKDYAEDVDNLLVFAGLFSAVLTAFLVESIAMLQVDNSDTNNKLLTRISTQLEGFPSRFNLANSTSVPPLPSDVFTASRAAVWINSLWFLSLIFSLSAAFFGIRVRQWLREYMQWNAALAHPRENVYVRQVRFEALETWKVLGSISLIPGLLELALVFFVSGIVIFLWTLNHTVAIVVTIATSIFLAVASITTILPAFLKRCPYKSPTAWACVLLCGVVFNIVAFGKRIRARAVEIGGPKLRLDVLLQAWRETTFGAGQARNWRRRDFEGGFLQTIRMKGGKTQDAKIAIRKELAVAVEGGDHIWAGMNDPQAGKGQRRGFDVEDEAALIRVSEVGWLSRALIWVMRSSQDSRLHQHVLRCIKSIHSASLRNDFRPKTVIPSPLSPLTDPNSIPHLADLYLLCRTWRGIDGVTIKSASLTTTTCILRVRFELHKLFGEHPCTTLSEHGVTAYRMYLLHEGAINIGKYTMDYGDDIELKMLAHVFVEDLQRLSAAAWYPLFADVTIWIVFELIAALLLVKAHNRTVIDNDCSNALVLSFNNCHARTPPKAEAHTVWGVKAAIFEVLFKGNVWFPLKYSFDESGCLVEIPKELRPPRRKPSATHDLIRSFVRAHINRFDKPDDFRIFVLMTREWIEHDLVNGITEPGQSTSILYELTACAELALKHSYMNCGYVHDLPWFGGLYRLWGHRFMHYNVDYLNKLWEGDPAPFRQLIDVLQTSNERNLLTGQIVTNLPFLARLAQAPLEVCGSKEQLRAWLEGIAGPGGEVPGPPISAMEFLGVGGDARTLEDSWRALPPSEHTQRPGYEDVELDVSSWLRTL